VGTRTLEPRIEDPLPAAALRFRGVAHLAAFVAAVPLGVVLPRRRPDPFPSTFGSHEVFHSLVVVALTCQYATIAPFVLPQA
jgi:predicted membrane channel-forming protein YqfA (hemolysin III family)